MQTKLDKSIENKLNHSFEIRPEFVELSSEVVIIEVKTVVVSLENDFVVVFVVVVGISRHSKVSQGHPLRQLF